MSRRPCRQCGLTDQPQPFRDDAGASAHNRDTFDDDPRASSASAECHALIRASSDTLMRPHVTFDDQPQYIRVAASGTAGFCAVAALQRRPCLAAITSALRHDAADPAASNRDSLTATLRYWFWCIRCTVALKNSASCPTPCSIARPALQASALPKMVLWFL